MITRGVIVRGLVFAALTLGLVLYVGAHFLGAFNFLGAPAYTVHMPLPDASGLFTRAEVTYRGVKVGTVGPLELNDRGLVANLELTGGGPKIPSDLKAVVASRSAVGERFVDLMPNTAQGPYLTDGDTIPANRVQLPIPVEDVLASLDTLTASVPIPDLQTTVGEFGKAFDNLGPKLQLLLDSTHSLVASANQYLPQTLSLIKDARTVLNTQNQLANPIRSFSSDLKQITGQLRSSDPDIRRLLDTGERAGDELSALVDESGDPLHRTLREALTLSQISRDHLRDTQSVLQLYPGLAAAIPTILPNDGKDRARLSLVLNLNDPALCGKGYEATVKPPAESTAAPTPLSYRAYCREPIYSPIDVRGVKPQYPFVDDQPQVPPEWFFAFYQDGRAAGIFGGPTKREGGHPRRERQDVNLSFSPAALPGLLNAPATSGEFGLLPAAH